MRRKDGNGLSIIQNILRSLMPVAAYYVISIGVTAIFMFLALRLNLTAGADSLVSWQTANGLPVMGIIEAVSIGLFVWQWQHDGRYRGEDGDPGIRGWKAGSWICLLLTGAGAALGMNLLLNVLQIPQGSAGMENLDTVLNSSSAGVRILVTCLLAPLAEELCFRGLLFKRLRDWLKPLPAILISACLFGIFHGNLPQFLYALVVGALFAYAYERSGTIIAPILMHIFSNVLIELLDAVGVLDLFMDAPAALVSGLVVSAAAVVFGVLKIRKMRCIPANVPIE